MMNATILTPSGPVRVHVDLGLPSFAILDGRDDREVRDRLRAAFVNCGTDWPMRRVTVDLCGADRQPGHDLPIAVGIAVASGQLDQPTGPLWGALRLNGETAAV